MVLHARCKKHRRTRTDVQFSLEIRATENTNKQPRLENRATVLCQQIWPAMDSFMTTTHVFKPLRFV